MLTILSNERKKQRKERKEGGKEIRKGKKRKKMESREGGPPNITIFKEILILND